ncbi:MAG: DUF4350 domain-containing protein [Promethearchaeota archaeon]
MSRKNNSNLNQMPNQPKAAEAKKRSKFFTLFVFCFVFAIAWLPIILSISGVGGIDNLAFSIYNTSPVLGDGCSELSLELENNGFEVSPLISSLSVVNGIPGNHVLCIIGPTHYFSIVEISALLDFFLDGGSLLLVDDFGSANTLLDGLALYLSEFGWPTRMENLMRVSAIRFTRNLLLDAGSNDGGRPLLPAINSFNDGGLIFSSGHHVVMNYATTIEVPGGTGLAMTSTNSWSVAGDVLSHIQQGGDPNYIIYNASRGDQIGPFPVMVEIQIPNGTLMLLSDPSIFINNMIDRGTNRQFAVELFRYLANKGNTNSIIIDHNHLGWSPQSPVLYVGLMLGQITYVSTNWLLAPLAPLLAIWMVRRYLPYGRPEKQKPMELYRLKGQTMFTKSLYDYINNHRYNDALEIIYGQLKRDLRRRYGLRIFDVPRLLVTVSRTRQPGDIALLTSDFEAIEKAIQESKKMNREAFLDLFFKIERIRDNIG